MLSKTLLGFSVPDNQSSMTEQYMIDGCHKDRMVVRVPFHARTLHIFIMTDLFFATYDELVLLTKAWKMHGPLSYVVVNIRTH